MRRKLTGANSDPHAHPAASDAPGSPAALPGPGGGSCAGPDGKPPHARRFLQQLRPKRPLHFLLLLALLGVGLLSAASLSLASLRLDFGLRGKLKRAKPAKPDPAAGPDPSGLASWKLKPERERMQRPSKFPLRYYSAEKAEVSIPRQMLNPYTHSKTGRRTFGCLRDECRGLAMEDLTDRCAIEAPAGGRVRSRPRGGGGAGSGACCTRLRKGRARTSSCQR
jgi:hypothetical protein